jgi:hypothetical protein
VLRVRKLGGGGWREGNGEGCRVWRGSRECECRGGGSLGGGGKRGFVGQGGGVSQQRKLEGRKRAGGLQGGRGSGRVAGA